MKLFIIYILFFAILCSFRACEIFAYSSETTGKNALGSPCIIVVVHLALVIRQQSAVSDKTLQA